MSPNTLRNLMPVVLLMMMQLPAKAQCEYGEFNLLDYRNPVDSALFNELAEGDTALLSLLIAAGAISDTSELNQYRGRLNQLFNSLDSARLVRKNPKKIIKTVFQTVHDQLLKKYEFQNQFCEIFQTGYYNCVSATAVYSYMLTRLGLENAIVETPNHVYVVALIEGEEWVMESTDPAQGFYQLKEKDRQRQLDYLVEQKMITAEQRHSPDLDSIINELYPSEAITAARLVSIQYANQGIYDLEEEKSYSAFQNMLRAFLISDDEFNSALLQEALAVWLAEEDYENPVFYKSVCNFITLDTSAVFAADIVQSYPYYGQLFIDRKLREAQFYMLTEAMIKGLEANGQDSARQEIEWFNKIVLAQDELENNNGAGAFSHAASAIQLKPLENDSRRVLLGSLGTIAYRQLWSNAALLDTMAAYQEEYPNLKELSWNSLYGELLLQSIQDGLINNDASSIEKYRRQFENLMDNAALEKQLTQSSVAAIYGRLALRDFNQSKTRARATLEKGLRYAPENPDLLRYGRIMGFQ